MHGVICWVGLLVEWDRDLNLLASEVEVAHICLDIDLINLKVDGQLPGSLAILILA